MAGYQVPWIVSIPPTMCTWGVKNYMESQKMPKKIKIIGLNYKDTKKNAESFLSELGNPFHQIIFDKEGINAIEWGAYGVPESFLIYDRKIIKKYIGPFNKQSIKEIKFLIK